MAGSPHAAGRAAGPPPPLSRSEPPRRPSDRLSPAATPGSPAGRPRPSEPQAGGVGEGTETECQTCLGRRARGGPRTSGRTRVQELAVPVTVTCPRTMCRCCFVSASWRPEGIVRFHRQESPPRASHAWDPPSQRPPRPDCLSPLSPPPCSRLREGRGRTGRPSRSPQAQPLAGWRVPPPLRTHGAATRTRAPTQEVPGAAAAGHVGPSPLGAACGVGGGPAAAAGTRGDQAFARLPQAPQTQAARRRPSDADDLLVQGGTWGRALPGGSVPPPHGPCTPR